MKGENAKADKYYQESKKWGDNGIYKVSLHASLGGFLSNYSGSNIISGVKASGVNESLQSLINKSTNPEFRKIISLVIGKVVSGDTGGALAEKATTYNWLEHQNRQDLNYDISQLLFTNAYGYDEDTRWSKLREKVAYYYALMEYERDYHDYYDSDNLVHATDGGHIGEPYYTDESYSALLNNLFAYVVGSDPDNINYYTHLKEYYYNKFVSEEKYIQDKGYNVRTYDAGWQESDGQYYNKLINGGTVLNGRFRGKQLELEGYPTVLGDDGQTYYTLDENGRPWYNPDPSIDTIDKLKSEQHKKLVDEQLAILHRQDSADLENRKNRANYTIKEGEDALSILKIQVSQLRDLGYSGTADSTEIFLYKGDKKDLIGKYGIVDVEGDPNDIQTITYSRDSNIGRAMEPSDQLKMAAVNMAINYMKEKNIPIDKRPRIYMSSYIGSSSTDQYFTVGKYIISPRLIYDDSRDEYYGVMTVVDRWNNEGFFAELNLPVNLNPINNAYKIELTGLRKPYNNKVINIPYVFTSDELRSYYAL